MDIVKKYGVGALVALVVALGVSYFVKPDLVDSDKVDINAIAQTVLNKVNTALGALPGSTILSSEFSVGGVADWKVSVGLTQATSSVICAMQSPTHATSSLTFGSFLTTSATGTALSLSFHKADTSSATTTIIGATTTILANARANVVSSSTIDSGDLGTFKPGQWLTVNLKNSPMPLTSFFNYTGACNASWTILF